MNQELFDFIKYNNELKPLIIQNQKAIIDDIFDGEDFNKSLYIKNYDKIVKKAVVLYKSIGDIEYDHRVALYLYEVFIEKFKSNPMKYKSLFPYWYDEEPDVDYIIKNYITGKLEGETMNILNKLVTEGKTTYSKGKIINSRSRIVISAKKPVLLNEYFNMLYSKGLKFPKFKDLEKHLTKVKAKVIKAKLPNDSTEDKFSFVSEMQNDLEFLVDNFVNSQSDLEGVFIKDMMEDFNGENMDQYTSKEDVLSNAKEFATYTWKEYKGNHGWTEEFLTSKEAKQNKLKEISDLMFSDLIEDGADEQELDKALDMILAKKEDKIQEIYNLLYSDDVKDVEDLDEKLKKILESKIMALSLEELDELENKLDNPEIRTLEDPMNEPIDEYDLDFLFDEMATDLATDPSLTEEDIVEYSEMTTELIKRDQEFKMQDMEDDFFEDTKRNPGKLFTEDEVRKRARLSSRRTLKKSSKK